MKKPTLIRQLWIAMLPGRANLDRNGVSSLHLAGEVAASWQPPARNRVDAIESRYGVR
jgi:hypothetical protein